MFQVNRMSAYLCGAAAIAVASPAMAQADNAGISDSEIIVTAQRREEKAQDVPIVITAYSSEKLSQLDITEPQDLYGTAPSLVVGNQGQATRDVQSFSIRGQSTGFLSLPAVAQYFAEVPLAAAITLNLQGAPGMFMDLENVQVLSGPQGTLFGRNTTGGAVLFVPKKPSNELEGYVEGGIGNYNLRAIEGALNVPLIDDKLMVRVAGTFRDRDGFTKDLVFNKDRDNVHYWSGRISVLAKPTERLSNLTVAFKSKSSNNGTGYIHKGFNIAGLKAVGFCSDSPNFLDPYNIATYCDAYQSQTDIADEIGPRKTRFSNDTFSKINLWGIINTTDFEISDNLTLRNIISYQRLKDDYGSDQDGTPFQQYELNQQGAMPTGPVEGLTDTWGLPLFGYTTADPSFNGVRDDIKQFTEELQLQGKGLDNHLDYAIGYFHTSAKPGNLWTSRAINYCPGLYTGLCGPEFGYSGVTNKSDAVYAQGTLDFGAFDPSLETLRLTAGIRHTWDTVSGFKTGWRPSTTGDPALVSCLEGGLIPNDVVPIGEAYDRCYFDATLKSKAFTWTVGLDYKPMDNLMVYAKVSKGYKAGGFNTYAVRAETRTFEPEKLTSYEAGFKSDWKLGGTMPFKFNATYYYSDYANIQRPTGDYNPATGGNGARTLPATATIQGVEIETSFRPIPELEIGGNFSHTDADYKEFTVPLFAPTVTCDGFVDPGLVLDGSVTGDFTCMPFQFSTAYIYSIYGSLDVPLGENTGDLSVYVNYSHVSSQGVAPLGNASTEPGSVLEPYGLLNGSITWKGVAGTGLDLTVFGTNLTNKLFRTANNNTYNSLLTWATMYGEPRMYGVKARYSF